MEAPDMTQRYREFKRAWGTWYGNLAVANRLEDVGDLYPCWKGIVVAVSRAVQPAAKRRSHPILINYRRCRPALQIQSLRVVI
jgi:hypothetical protein